MLPALDLLQNAVLLAFMFEAPEGFFYAFFIPELNEYHEYHHLDRVCGRFRVQPGGQFIFRPASRW